MPCGLTPTNINAILKYRTLPFWKCTKTKFNFTFFLYGVWLSCVYRSVIWTFLQILFFNWTIQENCYRKFIRWPYIVFYDPLHARFRLLHTPSRFFEAQQFGNLFTRDLYYKIHNHDRGTGSIFWQNILVKVAT